MRSAHSVNGFLYALELAAEAHRELVVVKRFFQRSYLVLRSLNVVTKRIGL